MLGTRQLHGPLKGDQTRESKNEIIFAGRVHRPDGSQVRRSHEDPHVSERYRRARPIGTLLADTILACAESATDRAGHTTAPQRTKSWEFLLARPGAFTYGYMTAVEPPPSLYIGP